MMRRALLGLGFLALSALPAWPALADSHEPQAAPLTATPLPGFQINAPERRQFGDLRFVGGLSIRSSNRHVGAFSGLSVTADNALLAIADTGFWMTAQITRDEAGRPIGFSQGRIGPLLDQYGVPFHTKWGADAEAVTLRNGRAFVALEQKARILAYPRSEDGGLTLPARLVVDTFPAPRLRNSFGLESITALPDGRLLAITEGSPNGSGPARAFLSAVSGLSELAVERRDGFYITDATVLPESGDVLLLERNFTPSRGPEMRLRQVDRSNIAAGAVLDGDVLLTVGRGYAIDNMEGISAFQDADGQTRIAIISDNNHWMLQRTLYLEFVLDEQG